MSAVHWMGDDIEALAELAGDGWRQKLADWVWHCGCRNRRPRYQALLRLATEHAHGRLLANDAADQLTSLIANWPARPESDPSPDD